MLVARSRLATDDAGQGKATLVRIVSMITNLIERHLRDAAARTSTSTSTSRNGPSRCSRVSGHQSTRLESGGSPITWRVVSVECHD